MSMPHCDKCDLTEQRDRKGWWGEHGSRTYCMPLDCDVTQAAFGHNSLCTCPRRPEKGCEDMDMEHKVARHREICGQLTSTYRRKNIAYGDSFNKSFNDLGFTAAITRMYDKLQRLIALNNGAENEVSDESMDDTLLDLANYAIMSYMFLESKKPTLDKEV